MNLLVRYNTNINNKINKPNILNSLIIILCYYFLFRKNKISEATVATNVKCHHSTYGSLRPSTLSLASHFLRHTQCFWYSSSFITLVIQAIGPSRHIIMYYTGGSKSSTFINSNTIIIWYNIILNTINTGIVYNFTLD